LYCAGATVLSAAAVASAAHAAVTPTSTRLISKVTGPGPLNFTDLRWRVAGTDLGSMFEYQGQIRMVFGDTFGSPNGIGPAPLSRWRSNTMAVVSNLSDPRVGPLFARMITNPSAPLVAKELLSSRKQNCANATGFCELTVIPNDGFAVGSRMYLHYMSIRRFDYPVPGDYDTNYSGLAYSNDGGQNWTKDPHVTWSADSGLGIVAATQTAGYVYLFGIPSGRLGSVRLARVPAGSVLDNTAYRYWDGTGWAPVEAAAAVVVGGPAGELSVQWNSYFGKWLMMYLRPGPRFDIVLRSADCLTGPWSAPVPVVTSDQYPTLYAPMLPPRWNDGPAAYFAMSIFTPYNVFWMRSALSGPHRPGLTPCVQ
jgi:hypothetical protein